MADISPENLRWLVSEYVERPLRKEFPDVQSVRLDLYPNSDTYVIKAYVGEPGADMVYHQYTFNAECFEVNKGLELIDFIATDLLNRLRNMIINYAKSTVNTWPKGYEENQYRDLNGWDAICDRTRMAQPPEPPLPPSRWQTLADELSDDE